MKKILILLFIPFILQGCVLAVVGAGAAGGAAATYVMYDKRSVTTIREDHALESLIQHKLDANGDVSKKCRIVVTVYNGYVLLLGQAPTDELKQEALDIVKTTEGIRRLYDEIEIQMPIGLKIETEDAWITTQAKTLLLEKKGLESASIKISTENGVVYLMGTVTKQQGKLAIETLDKMSDPKEIVELFEYTAPSSSKPEVVDRSF